MPKLYNRGLTLGILGLTLVWAVRVSGAEPAEALFRLVPPNAGLTIAIEDLRGHAARFLDSPLAQGLGQLPAVGAWRKSDRFRGFQLARKQIEKVLGKDLAEVRDDLLGDVVLLSAHLLADERPDQAHGLLLTRVRDRALLDRAIREVNAAQTRKGEITEVVAQSWKGVPYSVRRFRAAAKPPDFYTTLDDDTFAWSNSEDLIRGVIDRKAGNAPGLGDVAKFQKVRRRLPKGAAASLFVDPAFFQKVLAGSGESRKPDEDRVVKLLERHLGAVEYAGAALEWRDGLVLHTEETIQPDRLDPWLRRWAAQAPRPAADEERRVPANALAVASAHVDFTALLELVETLVPESEHAQLDNVLDVLRGLLLGRDVRSAVLPYLGPEVLAYIEGPAGDGARGRPPIVVTVRLGGEAGVADALRNGLRTFLALYALDPKHGKARLKVETRPFDGTEVTALGASSPFAFAVLPGRLVVGTTAEAVARACSAGSNPRLEQFRAHYFPNATTFACADLVALHRFLADHRDAIARRFAT